MLSPWLQHYWEYMREQPRYADPLRLLRYGAKAYSQHDEDGLVAEVFRRIGVGAGTFVELGVGAGLENNTLALLLGGWRGLWIDANEEDTEKACTRLSRYIDDGRLRVEHHFVTRDNVDGLLASAAPNKEPDLLSIDIDGNDYWVWQAVSSIRPRVVIIEYNATWFPPLAMTIAYDESFRWDGTNYFGASLKALEILGRQKGYHLVGCDFSGTNAFFVRQDLCGERFCAPFDADNHYEPARYWITHRPSGHKPGVGVVEPIFDVAPPEERALAEAVGRGTP